MIHRKAVAQYIHCNHSNEAQNPFVEREMKFSMMMINMMMWYNAIDDKRTHFNIFINRIKKNSQIFCNIEMIAVCTSVHVCVCIVAETIPK